MKTTFPHLPMDDGHFDYKQKFLRKYWEHVSKFWRDRLGVKSMIWIPKSLSWTSVPFLSWISCKIKIMTAICINLMYDNLIPSWYFSSNSCLLYLLLQSFVSTMVGSQSSCACCKRKKIRYKVLHFVVAMLYTSWVLFKRSVINLKNKSIKLMATQEWYMSPITNKQSNVNKWILPTHHQNEWNTKKKQT
jgi:hypothetical protein